MPIRARRLPARPWIARARRALLVLCLSTPSLLSAAEPGICGAGYAVPTDAYPHGVLGDALEWAELRITVASDCAPGTSGAVARHRITLADDSVFEDLMPRLWDVTGDGAPEVVAVRSHQALGAQLVIYGLRGTALVELAATPHIGQRFRWLAPVGAADLDGDGQVEIAYVDRPHLARTLRIWRFTADGLSQVQSVPNVTNHKIGWDYIPGGLRTCGAFASLVVASGDWSRIIEITLSDGVATRRDLGAYTGPGALQTALSCD